MPKDKDLKRLTRARMEKTGESYTAARARLVEKRGRSTPARVPKPDYAALAGMSDDAVRKKTGCDWKEWVGRLDAMRAYEWPHREIAKHVGEKFDVSGWWAQTVAVGYERIKGLREIGQRRAGTYDANKSKTLPVPVEKLYRAFRLARTRNRWLPDTPLEVRTATPSKSMRVTWHDGTSVSLYFTSKGANKSQVQIQHGKLPSKKAVEKTKAYWTERLAALTDVLVPSKG